MVGLILIALLVGAFVKRGRGLHALLSFAVALSLFASASWTGVYGFWAGVILVVLKAIELFLVGVGRRPSLGRGLLSGATIFVLVVGAA